MLNQNPEYIIVRTGEFIAVEFIKMAGFLQRTVVNLKSEDFLFRC